MTKPRSRRRLYGREADLAGVEQGGADPDDRVAKVPSLPTKTRRAPPKAAVARARARAAHKARVEGMRADARTRAQGMARERAAQAKAKSAARGRVPPRELPSGGGGYSGPSKNPVTPRPSPGTPKAGPTQPRRRGPGVVKATGIASAMRRGADEDKYSGTVSSR